MSNCPTFTDWLMSLIDKTLITNPPVFPADDPVVKLARYCNNQINFPSDIPDRESLSTYLTMQIKHKDADKASELNYIIRLAWESYDIWRKENNYD